MLRRPDNVVHPLSEMLVKTWFSNLIRTDFGDYKYLGFFAMLNITFMLISNFIAPRLVTLWGASVSVSVYYFPAIYLIADILTEVYGYGQARKIMWLSLVCKLLASIIVWLALLIPASPLFVNDPAFQIVLSSGLRAAVASIFAFAFGDVGCSYILAKMKVWNEGKYLGARFVASTIIGEGINTLIFYGVAFGGMLETSSLVKGMVVAWAAKTLWEIIALPLTYKLVNYLKRAEAIDYFDRDTDFNPFLI